MSDNAIHITGNMTRAAELRFLPSGQAVASFGIAVNTRKKGASGDYEDGDPQFYDVTTFGTLAENVSESLEKGHRVTLNGRLNFSSWEDNDGNKRNKVDIVADSVGPYLRWANAVVTRNEKS